MYNHSFDAVTNRTSHVSQINIINKDQKGHQYDASHVNDASSYIFDLFKYSLNANHTSQAGLAIIGRYVLFLFYQNVAYICVRYYKIL